MIRASEIGAYIYCQRAWWYRKSGYEPQNKAELAAGSELHERHGRAVLVTGCLRSLALGLLLAAIVLVVLAITLHSL